LNWEILKELGIRNLKRKKRKNSVFPCVWWVFKSKINKICSVKLIPKSQLLGPMGTERISSREPEPQERKRHIFSNN
jgi:hypothetical protein